MYSITIQNPKDTRETLIFSDVYGTEEHKIESAKLQLAVNSAGSLSIKVPPQNVGYNKIQHLTTIFRVYREDDKGIMREYWRGRSLTEDADFNNMRNIFCEGELAFLNDTTQAPKVMVKTQSITAFIAEILNNHNSNYDNDDENYKFYVGNVTVDDTDEEVEYRYSDYETTLNCLTENLLNRYGGIFVVRHEDENGVDKRYLDYLSDYPGETKQQIELGKNLTDLTRNWDLSDFATVVIPLGAQLDQPMIENNVIYKPAGTYHIFIDPETKYYARTSEIDEVFFNVPTLVVGDLNYRRPLTFKMENDVGYMGYLNKASGSSAAQFVTLNTVEDTYPRPVEYVTIEEANDGDRKLTNPTAVYEYGWHEKIEFFDDVTDPEILKILGGDFLSNSQFDGVEISLNAVDLHYLNRAIESIDLLDLVQVISKPHGLDRIFAVTELEIPLTEPQDATIVLGGSMTGRTISITDQVAFLNAGVSSRPVTKQATIAPSST